MIYIITWIHLVSDLNQPCYVSKTFENSGLSGMNSRLPFRQRGWIPGAFPWASQMQLQHGTLRGAAMPTVQVFGRTGRANDHGRARTRLTPHELIADEFVDYEFYSKQIRDRILVLFLVILPAHWLRSIYT